MMTIKTQFVFLTLFISSCMQSPQDKNKKKFDNFVFSYSEEGCDYSIRFSNSDTVLLQKRFPRPKETFFAVILAEDKTKLDSFLNIINFADYDTAYIQDHLQDGGSYKFYLIKDTSNKWTFIYGDEGPKALYNFGNWLRDLKDRQSFNPIDTIIDFGNLKYMLLPEVPPPPRIKNSR